MKYLKLGALSTICILSACGGDSSDRPLQLGPELTRFDIESYSSTGVDSTDLTGLWVLVGERNIELDSIYETHIVKNETIRTVLSITDNNDGTLQITHCLEEEFESVLRPINSSTQQFGISLWNTYFQFNIVNNVEFIAEQTVISLGSYLNYEILSNSFRAVKVDGQPATPFVPSKPIGRYSALIAANATVTDINNEPVYCFFEKKNEGNRESSLDGYREFAYESIALTGYTSPPGYSDLYLHYNSDDTDDEALVVSHPDLRFPTFFFDREVTNSVVNHISNENIEGTFSAEGIYNLGASAEGEFTIDFD